MSSEPRAIPAPFTPLRTNHLDASSPEVLSPEDERELWALESDILETEILPPSAYTPGGRERVDSHLINCLEEEISQVALEEEADRASSPESSSSSSLPGRQRKRRPSVPELAGKTRELASKAVEIAQETAMAEVEEEEADGASSPDSSSSPSSSLPRQWRKRRPSVPELAGKTRELAAKAVEINQETAMTEVENETV